MPSCTLGIHCSRRLCSAGGTTETQHDIIGKDLPGLESLHQQRLLGTVILISRDSSHPAHELFDPLPSDPAKPEDQHV